MDLFSIEELILLNSIITQKNWKLAPREKEFFDTLEQIKQASDSQYYSYLDHFQKKCSNLSYQTIKPIINGFIKGDYQLIE